MFANRLPTPPKARRAIAAIAAIAGAVLLCGAAQALGLRVLMADPTSAQIEFVHQLRETQDPASRFELVQLSAAAAPAGGSPSTLPADDDHVVPGVHGRDGDLTIAVGMAASRAAIERPGQDPLVLAMLGRLDYESLKGNPALRHPGRPIGVLLREPAMADQLNLIDAMLPQRRRLGVLATTESESIVGELQRAGQGWDLQVEYAPDAQSLAAVLRLLVARSDALMVLPDMIGDSQAATLAVLRAGAGAGLPVFGTNEGLVRSGGLAAAVSTPAQLAQQARALGLKLVAAGGSGGGVRVEAAAPSTVRVNATVARGLHLRLPDEHALKVSR